MHWRYLSANFTRKQNRILFSLNIILSYVSIVPHGFRFSVCTLTERMKKKLKNVHFCSLDFLDVVPAADEIEKNTFLVANNILYNGEARTSGWTWARIKMTFRRSHRFVSGNTSDATVRCWRWQILHFLSCEFHFQSATLTEIRIKIWKYSFAFHLKTLNESIVNCKQHKTQKRHRTPSVGRLAAGWNPLKRLSLWLTHNLIHCWSKWHIARM